MRVIAGKFRSRILKSLKGQALRPTSDRLRETIFDVLANAVEGSRFLDIFAGTGAVGIEALSRGASSAVFIEKHRAAVRIIHENLETLGLTAVAQIFSGDATRTLEKLGDQIPASSAAFDLAFVDPPYASNEEYSQALMFLGSSTILREGAIVVAEHHHKKQLPESSGALRRFRVLRQGDAALTFYRKTGPSAA